MIKTDNSIAIFDTMNQFGDERMQDCSGSLTGTRAIAAAETAAGFNPAVLGISLWECFAPWSVPRRRIGDNFLLLVSEGAERCRVGERERILERGDVMVAPEFVAHSFELAPGCTHCSHFIIHSLVGAGEAERWFGAFPEPFLWLEDADSFFRRLYRAAAIFADDATAGRVLIAGMLKEWWLMLAADGILPVARNPVRDSRIREAIAYLEARLDRPFGVEVLAELAGLGPVRFRCLFKRETGVTPALYLLRARLRRAIRLLAETPMTLAQIAAVCGFSGECYFCAAFKRVHRCTPGAYRRLLGKFAGTQ